MEKKELRARQARVLELQRLLEADRRWLKNLESIAEFQDFFPRDVELFDDEHCGLITDAEDDEEDFTQSELFDGKLCSCQHCLSGLELKCRGCSNDSRGKRDFAMFSSDTSSNVHNAPRSTRSVQFKPTSHDAAARRCSQNSLRVPKASADGRRKKN